MADSDTQVLIKLGPFKSFNTRAAQEYLPPGDGVVTTNCDTHRLTGSLSNAFGRQHFVDLPILGPTESIGYLAQYAVSQGNAFYIAETPETSGAKTASYDPNSGVIQSLSGMTDAFTQGVQSNGMLFLNNGQQIFFGEDGKLHVALWQYPAPAQSMYNYSVALLLNAGGSGGLQAATYRYAFVQVITLPTFGKAVQQSTSPTGTNGPPFPYAVVVTQGDLSFEPLIQISGTFAGTTADGYAFVTQIYRMSTNNNAWYLLTTKSDNAPYQDSASDNSIQSKQQLVLNYDQPPTGVGFPGALGTVNPIASFEDRMWVLARIQGAATSGQPETQLWYSYQGLPWAFNAEQQVLLVGSENTTLFFGAATVPYGDQVAGLAVVGSYLLAFKTLSTWLITGVDEQTYQPLPLFSDIGLIAPQSLTRAEGMVVWLSAQGAFTWDGGNLVDITTEKLYNALAEILPESQTLAVGAYADRTWLLSFPNQGVTYAYYFPTKEWTTLPYAMSAAVYYPAIRSVPAAFSGNKWNQVVGARTGTTTLDLWLQDGENDLGVPATLTWTAPLNDSGTPYAAKDYQYVNLSAPAQSAKVTITVAPDPGFPGSAAPFVSDPIDLSGATGAVGGINIRIPQNSCIGYTAQVTVTATLGAGATEPLEIRSVSVGGSIKRMWSQPSG